MKEIGYIYVLKNVVFKDDLLKIGRTSRLPDIRANELSSNTNMPSDFTVCYSKRFLNSYWAEKEIFEKLDRYRVNPKREFFNCALKQVKEIIIQTAITEYEDEVQRLNLEISELKIVSKTDDFDKVKIRLKWANFFENLNWEYVPHENVETLFKHQPDFILKTKGWKDDPYSNDVVFKKPTFIFIHPKVNKDFIEYNNSYFPFLEDLKESFSNYYNAEKFRLFILGLSPLDRIGFLNFGWKYDHMHQTWDKVFFTQHYDNVEPKIGLLDEDMSWFCMIRGVLISKENIGANPNDVLLRWE